MKKTLTILAAILALASCASHRAATEATTGTTAAAPATAHKTTTEQAAFVQRVAANAMTAQNIVASADLRLVSGSKDLSCDGKLSMRRGEIIRLQLLLPIIRTEIARIDFTPDHVLLVDRYHKEYIKAAYADVSFLADNGITFYSLQSLFWNELFVPGEKTMGDAQLKRLACDLAAVAATAALSYSSGSIGYRWTVDKATAQIRRTDIAYSSPKHGTATLAWNYADFKTVGGKAFPLSQQFAVQTTVGGKQQAAQLTVRMSSPKTSADWDATTQLSAKYKKIEAQDILKKLLSIQ